MSDDLLQQFSDIVEKYKWTEPNILLNPPMTMWVLHFPNNYGLIIRKDNSKKAGEFVGLMDSLGFEDNYYFDRPKKHNITRKSFSNVEEALRIIRDYMEYEPYESK